ncbi:MAG: hypothetical protein L0Y71_22875 [Gemmataceae bacterium]|nr:hypothetical protein [Gemmataceae bacterium]
MRTQTRWLALVLVSACGTAASAQSASAQSPVMYGMQPYPPYPHPWSQPRPTYYAPPRYAPPRYAPPATYQPQPRVIYVPASPSPSPAPWYGAPTSPPTQLPPPASNPAGQQGSVTVVEPAAPVAKVLTKPAARNASGAAADSTQDAPEAVAMPAEVYVAPEACLQPHCDDHANWLPKGHWDVQILGGCFGDIGDANYNWAQTSIRLGRVWCCECFSFLPGGVEGLIDVNGASTMDSAFGNHFFGGGLIGRYNLVTLGSRIVPYVQGGVGFQYNDAYRDPVQQFLGSRIALTAQADVGLRLFLTKCCSIDLEGGYRFISGLSMSDRDEGISALGGMAGVTFFFPRGRH